jgi:hypothetical protein
VLEKEEEEEAGGQLKYGFDALLLLLPQINPTTPSASTINSLNFIAFNEEEAVGC